LDEIRVSGQGADQQLVRARDAAELSKVPDVEDVADRIDPRARVELHHEVRSAGKDAQASRTPCQQRIGFGQRGGGGHFELGNHRFGTFAASCTASMIF
jgi:hypothetical protein